MKFPRLAAELSERETNQANSTLDKATLTVSKINPISVKINDPFVTQCLVTDVEGKDVFVSYRQLRNKPCSRETNPDNEN